MEIIRAFIDEKGELVAHIKKESGEILVSVVRKTRKSAEKYNFVVAHIVDPEHKWAGNTSYLVFTAHKTEAAAMKAQSDYDYWRPESFKETNPNNINYGEYRAYFKINPEVHNEPGVSYEVRKGFWRRPCNIVHSRVKTTKLIAKIEK